MSVLSDLAAFAACSPMLVVVALVLLAICANCVYSVALHPLARYPGPHLAKITNLYAAFHAAKEDLHLDILRCHRKYGKFVRYGPNRLLVDSTQGLHDIYDHKRNVQKARAYLPMVPDGTGWTTMTSIQKDSHSQRRKLVSKMMSADSLAIFEPQLLKHLDQLCEELVGPEEVQWSSPQTMHNLCQELTTDAISEFLFGVPIGKTQRKVVIQALRGYSWRMGIYIQCPSLTLLHVEAVAKVLGIGKQLRKAFEAWVQGYGQSALKDRRGHFAIFQDAGAGDAEKEIGHWTNDELWAEGFFLTWAVFVTSSFRACSLLTLSAGSDTSSTTISALLFYLSRNPVAFSRLATEVRNVFPTIDSIRSGPKLNSCTYLAACVRETLRCCPSTPGAPWREVQEGGAFVDGEHVPAGLDVGVCIYSLQHREDYFFEPQKWVPERWTEGNVSQEASDAVNPFSIGPRSCAGKSMAYLQISLVMVRLIWEFDFKVAEGEAGRMGEGGSKEGPGREVVGEYQLKANVTSQSNGPVLIFKRREFLN